MIHSLPTRSARTGVLLAGLLANTAAFATALDFTLFNATAASQSRLNLQATGSFAGAPLTAAPQLVPGGFNGSGSASTLYNDTGSGSRLATDVTQQSLRFVDSSGAIARNATGTLGNALAIGPTAGGASGSAAANYGLVFSSPQNVAIPPIDLTPLGVALTLNLGTLTSFDAKIALRGLTVQPSSEALALSAFGGPQSFSASALKFELGGTADLLIGATAKQASFVDYLAAGLALTALQSALAGQGAALTIQNNGFVALSYTIGLGLSTAVPDSLWGNASLIDGSLAQVGSTLRLTLPMDFEFAIPTAADFLFSAQYRLSGQLLGQTPFIAVEVPEAPIWAMSLFGGLVLAWASRRRQRCLAPLPGAVPGAVVFD